MMASHQAFHVGLPGKDDGDGMTRARMAWYSACPCLALSEKDCLRIHMHDDGQCVTNMCFGCSLLTGCACLVSSFCVAAL